LISVPVILCISPDRKISDPVKARRTFPEKSFFTAYGGSIIRIHPMWVKCCPPPDCFYSGLFRYHLVDRKEKKEYALSMYTVMLKEMKACALICMRSC